MSMFDYFLSFCHFLLSMSKKIKETRRGIVRRTIADGVRRGIYE